MSPLQALDDIGITFMSILIKQDYLAAFIVPTILAFLITLFQFFYGLRGIQQGILKMYRGDYELIPYKKHLSNFSILSNSTHFSGFLVGYLIWGFLLIFSIIFAVAF